MDPLETGMSTDMRTGADPATLRVAAAGDVHADPSRRADLEAAFSSLRGQADLVLLAGDLTTYGQPDEAQIVADASKLAASPTIAQTSSCTAMRTRAGSRERSAAFLCSMSPCR
jgi:hypothetical protein